MFSIRFRRRLRLRRRHNDFYLSRRNCLRYTLHMWDKESIGQLDHRTLDQDMGILITEDGFRNIICKMLAILPKW